MGWRNITTPHSRRKKILLTLFTIIIVIVIIAISLWYFSNNNVSNTTPTGAFNLFINNMNKKDNYEILNTTVCKFYNQSFYNERLQWMTSRQPVQLYNATIVEIYIKGNLNSYAYAQCEAKFNSTQKNLTVAINDYVAIHYIVDELFEGKYYHVDSTIICFQIDNGWYLADIKDQT